MMKICSLFVVHCSLFIVFSLPTMNYELLTINYEPNNVFTHKSKFIPRLVSWPVIVFAWQINPQDRP